MIPIGVDPADVALGARARLDEAVNWRYQAQLDLEHAQFQFDMACQAVENAIADLEDAERHLHD